MIYYSYANFNLEYLRFYYGVCIDMEKAEIVHKKGLIDLTKQYTNWKMLYHEEIQIIGLMAVLPELVLQYIAIITH